MADNQTTQNDILESAVDGVAPASATERPADTTPADGGTARSGSRKSSGGRSSSKSSAGASSSGGKASGGKASGGRSAKSKGTARQEAPADASTAEGPVPAPAEGRAPEADAPATTRPGEATLETEAGASDPGESTPETTESETSPADGNGTAPAARSSRSGRSRRSTRATSQPLFSAGDDGAAFSVGPDEAPGPDAGTQDSPDEDEDAATEESPAETESPRLAAAALLFQAPDLSAAPRRRPVPVHAEDEEPAEESPEPSEQPRSDEGSEQQPGSSRRRRGSRGRRKPTDEASSGEQAAPEGTEGDQDATAPQESDSGEASEDSAPEESGQQHGGGSQGEGSSSSSSRRRRRRVRSSSGGDSSASRAQSQVTSVEGSTRLEAKRQRRREGREAGLRRQVITESEFLARRESVDRQMVVREQDGLNQIAVLEDGVLVEHYVARRTQTSMVGNVYLGRVQNVLPSMEAAFVDIGKGRNAVLYAGEVNWDALGTEGQPRRIEQALKSGDPVLVQVTKDPIGHKGARLTSQVTLAGRHLVLVPSGSMTGISRKLPENERNRLKKLLKEIVPAGYGVIVRTAAEGATEEQLRDDVDRLVKIWTDIEAKAASTKSAPVLLKGEAELAVRVVRDIFNEDFTKLVVSGRDAYAKVSEYVSELSPDLADRVEQWVDTTDVFSSFRVDEQLAKGMDRKVWLPSGGSLVIDRTEAMTVIDVNTGRFTGSGGSLEETVTKNNLEAAEEIVRQLRLRDIGGIIVIDFIDMVLESNRDLVLRRLIECLGRDRTRHQVAEVTSLGLVQMTRKRVGQGLVEAFSETCQHCLGRGFIVHSEPVEKQSAEPAAENGSGSQSRRNRRGSGSSRSGSSTSRPAPTSPSPEPVDEASRQAMRATMATIAAAAANAHDAPAQDDDAAASVLEAAAGARAAADGEQDACETRGAGTEDPGAEGAAPEGAAYEATDAGAGGEARPQGSSEDAASDRERSGRTVAVREPAEGTVAVRERAGAVTIARTTVSGTFDSPGSREPEAIASPTRAPRGGRRRVVASGAPADSDPSSGIIALPAPHEPAESAAPTLPVSLLDSLVFPERAADAPAGGTPANEEGSGSSGAPESSSGTSTRSRRQPRRATAPAVAPPSADGETSNAGETGGGGGNATGPEDGE